MARKRRKEIVDPNNGIPITIHDIRGHTAASELKMYRAISILFGAAAFVFVILGLIPGITYLTGAFWVAALLCASVVLAYFPFTWGWDRERTLPEKDAVAALDQRRAASFWYERGVHDTTPEAVYDHDANVVRPAEPEDRPSP